MMSPLWASDTLGICQAPIDKLEWESDTGWWWCQQCGHCSNLHSNTHYVAVSPEEYHSLSLAQFYKRRNTQEFPDRDAQDQALHIAAVAIRVAASKRPEEFAKLVDDIIALAD
jgi:hypothetical protein